MCACKMMFNKSTYTTDILAINYELTDPNFQIAIPNHNT